MRSQARLLALTVLAAFLGLGAWMLFGEPREPASPGGDLHQRPADPGLAPPVLHGREREIPREPEPVVPAAPTSNIALAVQVLGEEHGRALEGAEVRVVQGKDAPRAFRTDGAGVAKVPDLTAGDVLVVARAPGYVRAEAHRDLVDDESAVIELRLARGIRLEGTVVASRTGLAVAGATVVASPGGSLDGWTEMSSASPFGAARTDEQGRFTIDGVAPEVLLTVRATAEGHGIASQSLRPAKAPTVVVLRLPPAGRLTGSVRQPGGEPAAGARIYAVPADAPETLLADPEAHCISDGRSYASLRAIADGDGGFRIDGLEIDALYVVFAELEGLGRSALKTGVVATEDDPNPRVDLLLQGAASLTVRVWSPDGQPQADGSLTLFGDGFPLNLELLSPGLFSLRDPPPGTYTLRVVCVGAVMQEQPVTIRAAEAMEVEIHLPRGLVLAGVLVDDAGLPIGNQKLFVGRPWQEAGKLLPSRGTAETDAQGYFHIIGLRDGPHVLGLVLGRHVVPDDLRLTPPNEALRLVVLRKAGFRAHLELPSGIAPPEQIGIRVGREEDGGFAESGHGAPWNGGELRFDDLAPGALRLRIQIEGLLEATRELTVKPGEIADLGTIVMEEGFELEGRVADREDRALAGVRVTAGEIWTPAHREVISDTDGRFVLPTLARGTNEIEIRAAGFLPRKVTVGMPEQASGRSFVLDRGCLVTVRVTESGGRPAPARHVRWRRAAATEEIADTESAESDARGRLEVRVREGAWIFELLDDEWNPVATGEVTATEGGTTTVELICPR